MNDLPRSIPTCGSHSDCLRQRGRDELDRDRRKRISADDASRPGAHRDQRRDGVPGSDHRAAVGARVVVRVPFRPARADVVDGLHIHVLWLFGPRLEHVWGSRGFALFYIWCGVGGAVFHALFGGLSYMVGASAAIFGVMLAYAMHWPKDEIYFFGVIPMRVATLVALLGALNLFYGVTAGDAGVAYFAHLGGFAFGFLYLKKPQHVSIDQLRQRVSPAPDVGDDMTPRASSRPPSRSRHRDEVDEIVARSKAAVAKRPRLGTDKVQPRDARSEELDRVLDKISKHGLSSLSPSERKLLEEMSKQLRDR
ncbi:MAG: rhomboid family intramembrane serine protease [Betaproteobacteria bacterium]|nr:MAG: rhomboid family intramembrane serine protease [Betaproteobacteria bacterium]